MPDQTNTCIVIAGATAVGKTAMAIKVARHFQTEIISADSRQCYRELNIGVAKPGPEELALVPHHFISSHSIREDVTAAVFEQYALDAAASLFRQHRVAVMVGGTGLYIKAFCEGLDAIPAIAPSIRNAIQESYLQHGLGWLQQQVQTLDPLYYETGEILNPQRLMRALEVMMGTGKSIRSYQGNAKKKRPFNIITIGLELPRPELYARINQRVDVMMAEGLLEEVRAVLPWRHHNALQTVGYAECFDFLDGKCSIAEATAAIKQHTRHYAKRQMTWFKKQPGIVWFSPHEADALIAFLSKKLSE